MKIIVESHIFPDSLVGKLSSSSKAGLDFAAHNFSQAMLSGFKENETDVCVINVPSVGSYPLLNKCFRIPSVNIDSGISIPFYNVPYFKRFEIVRNKLKYIESYMRTIASHEDVVYITYNLKSREYLSELKRIRPTLKICSIITDLPENMNTPKQFGIFKKKGTSTDDINTDLIDGFILFAPLMAERLHVGNRPWIHLEGIYNPEGASCRVAKEKFKTILYTGNLGRKYGVMEMLKAFSMIKDSNYRLWIRGGGECETLVRQEAERDNRVEFFESMGRKQIIELQHKATILLNPVKPSESFTRYFFPSKTLEYMASGTPVLMYHLDCMPQEYNNYVYYIKDEDVETLSNTIIETCSRPQEELNSFGARAAAFINQYKTPKSQTKRIVDFVLSL